MSDVTFEQNLVSIVRTGGVSIAYPAGMSSFELASVLHGLVGALFQGELAASSEAVLPVEPSPEPSPEPTPVQGPDRKTLGDRRGLPRCKVVKRSRNGKKETLECGTVIDPVPSNWKKHKSRACEACAAEALATA
jgi:hypothetical protein